MEYTHGTVPSSKRPLDEDSSIATTFTSKKANETPTRNRELTTVLVKNLPKSYNQNKVYKYFEDCGPIVHVDVADSLKKSFRFARLEFARYDSALAALTKTYKTVGQNEILVSHLIDCTLWMTNFPPNYTQRDIKRLFQDINVVILSIRLPSLRFNTRRRFTYIDVTSKEDANICVEKLNGFEIEGYKLVTKISNPLERSKRTDSATLEGREVIIRNLSTGLLDENILRDSFEQFGCIEKINIPTGQKEHKFNNCCAFIVFERKCAAEKALEMDKTSLHDREIAVSLADKKPFLERNEVKRLLALRNSKELQSLICLFPLTDKVSPIQIEDFLQKEIHVDKKLVEKVLLVSDFNGAIVIFRDEKLAAKMSMLLNGSQFQGKVIRSGSINDMKKYHSNEQNPNVRDAKPSLTNMLQKKRPSHQIKNNSSEKKEQMSNDDFRRMFLGK
ncbi:prp24p [Saccharomyces arboricola H-6]|uniref:U4/U6 snRNA-associated-splicing factor PRP24 n=1 Tax=Saccharomyces arboricola (strain H-6 / AS 2.3317 / CBS 10644) TaxID=1160507 RepID=J8LPZ3_SACAR|nr:prp24p [Saccharomyces arboricola H-6]